MDVELESLTPSMQNLSYANLAAQIALAIGFQEVANGTHEEVVNLLSIPEHQRVELVGDGKNGVIVGDREEPLFLLQQPALLLEMAALGTMAILAGIVLKVDMTTEVAHP